MFKSSSRRTLSCFKAHICNLHGTCKSANLILFTSMSISICFMRILNLRATGDETEGTEERTFGDVGLRRGHHTGSTLWGWLLLTRDPTIVDDD